MWPRSIRLDHQTQIREKTLKRIDNGNGRRFRITWRNGDLICPLLRAPVLSFQSIKSEIETNSVEEWGQAWHIV